MALSWSETGWVVLGVLIVCVLVVDGVGAEVAQSEPAFRAGVASVRITPAAPGAENADGLFKPAGPIYLDGYYADRAATGVRDDLYAKALVLDDGNEQVALVSVDLIGLFGQWADAIKVGVLGLEWDHIVVACSHTHSSPCTLGVFGPAGKAVNLNYVSWVIGRIVEAIGQAQENLRPARLLAGAVELPVRDQETVGVAHNWHNPGVFDPSVAVLQVRDAATDTPLATIVNFGNHPDVLTEESTVISSDWVHEMRRRIAEKAPGEVLFFNGALGGIEPVAREPHEQMLRQLGYGVADAALQALEKAEAIAAPAISVASESVPFPVTSPDLLAAVGAGVVPVPLDTEGRTLADISLIQIGPVQMVTVPGEPHPEVTAKVKAMMTGRYNFILGLANHELGYFVALETWDPEGVQESLSAGRDNEPILLETVRRLLDALK